MNALDLLEHYPDVTAVDTGYRLKGGVEQVDGDICLRVWVKNKRKKSEIEPSQLLPETIDGIAVDVLEGEVALVVCYSSIIVYK